MRGPAVPAPPGSSASPAGSGRRGAPSPALLEFAAGTRRGRPSKAHTHRMFTDWLSWQGFQLHMFFILSFFFFNIFYKKNKKILYKQYIYGFL